MLMDIYFTLDDGTSHQTVSVAGEFSNWQPVNLDKLGDGSFKTSVKLEGGAKYTYKFIVDGEWKLADNRPTGE